MLIVIMTKKVSTQYYNAESSAWKGTVDSQQQSGITNSCFKDTGKLAEIVLMFLYSYSRMQRDGQSQFPSFTAVKGNQQFEDWRWWQPFVSVLVLQACGG